MSRYTPLPVTRTRRALALLPLLGAVTLAAACTTTEDPPGSAPATTAPATTSASAPPTEPPIAEREHPGDHPDLGLRRVARRAAEVSATDDARRGGPAEAVRQRVRAPAAGRSPRAPR